LSTHVFGFPISAPSITLTDAAGLVTDAVTADTVTADTVTADAVATILVAPTAPAVDSALPGPSLQVAAADGAFGPGLLAGGPGGTLELFAGSAGGGAASAVGGSVVLRAGDGGGTVPGVSGLIRVDNGPLIISGGLVDLGGLSIAALSAGQLRLGLVKVLPSSADSFYSLPSPANLVQNFPGVQENDIIRFSVINQSSNYTITVGSQTFIGSNVVGLLESASFGIIMTNVLSGNEAYSVCRLC
jgi:hypothetical protein